MIIIHANPNKNHGQESDDLRIKSPARTGLALFFLYYYSAPRKPQAEFDAHPSSLHII